MDKFFLQFINKFFFIENSFIFVILDNDKLYVLKLYYLNFKKINNNKKNDQLFIVIINNFVKIF